MNFNKNRLLINNLVKVQATYKYPLRYQPNLITLKYYSSPSSPPSKTDANKYFDGKEELSANQGFIGKFKELFHFYKEGIKQIFKNRKEAQLIKQNQKNGLTITRREYQMIHNSDTDFNKLIPFGFLLLILPESIPFVIVFAPQFVPSTCISEEQMLKKRNKLQEQRNSITEFAMKSTRNNEHLLTLKDFSHIENVSKALNNYHQSFQLSLIEKKALKGYLKFMGIATFGPMGFLQRRLDNHFKYLNEDDKYLIKEGCDDLSEKELILALEERGLRNLDLNASQMKNSLQFWLKVKQLDNPIPPPIFLVLMNIFRNNLAPGNKQ